MYNYSGIKESNPQAVLSRWDISLHLPEAIQQIFKHTVGEYLLKVYRHNEKQKEAEQLPSCLKENIPMESANASAANKENGLDKEQIQLMDTVEDYKKEPDHDFICQLIDEHFSQKMYEKVANIQR